jgi:hypothetical protein
LVFGVIAAERQSEDTAIGGLGAQDSLERHASIGIGIRCSWGPIVDRLDGWKPDGDEAKIGRVFEY